MSGLLIRQVPRERRHWRIVSLAVEESVLVALETHAAQSPALRRLRFTAYSSATNAHTPTTHSGTEEKMNTWHGAFGTPRSIANEVASQYANWVHN